MFSILIRYHVSQREVLISAKTVEFIRPSKKGDPTPTDIPGLLVNHGVEAEDGCHLGMTEANDPDWRDVFVMNDRGATVARYTL